MPDTVEVSCKNSRCDAVNQMGEALAMSVRWTCPDCVQREEGGDDDLD